MNWRRLVARSGPWCGIIAPGIDALVNGAVAAVQPTYHPLNDYLSDLGAPEVPYSGVIRGWWIAFPILFGPFALAVYFHLQCTPSRWLPVALLLGFSVALCFCGILPCDPGCAGKTASAQAHFAFSYTAAGALYLSPLALGLASWNDERWRGYQWINIACLLTGAGTGGALFLAGRYVIPHPGLWERLYFGVFYLWVVLIALRMMYLERFLPSLD